MTRSCKEFILERTLRLPPTPSNAQRKGVCPHLGHAALPLLVSFLKPECPVVWLLLLTLRKINQHSVWSLSRLVTSHELKCWFSKHYYIFFIEVYWIISLQVNRLGSSGAKSKALCPWCCPVSVLHTVKVWCDGHDLPQRWRWIHCHRLLCFEFYAYKIWPNHFQLT